MFEDFDINRLLSDMALALSWGRSPIEVIWNTKGRYWYPERLEQKPARWFKYDDKNNTLFMPYATTEGVMVPERKLLMVTHQPSYDNPYGIKLLSKSYWPVTFKKQMWRWWNQGIEKNSLPYLLAILDPGNFKTKQAQVFKTLQSLLHGGVATVEKGTELEFLQSSGNKQGNDIYMDFNSAMNDAISKVWEGSTLNTDMGDNGSRAAAESQGKQSVGIWRADANLCETYTNQLIQWICDFNFPGMAPKFVLQPEFEASKALADRDAVLTEKMGVRFTKEYFELYHGLDADMFELAEPEKKEPEEPKDGGKEPEEKEEKEFSFSASFAKTAEAMKDQKAVDAMLETYTAAELQAEMETVLQPVIDLVMKAESYSDVAKKVAKLYPDLNTKGIEQILLKSIFASQTMGRLNNAT
jgi:phage gp29-like protein